MKSLAVLLTLTLLALHLFTGPAMAHPHAFIAQKTRLIFDDKGLAGFKVFWAFDEMFSAMIAEDFDSDGNGSLSPEEVVVIREKAFKNISEFQYYLHVKIQGKPFEVKYVRDFNARLEQGILFYEFLVPCHVTATAKGKQIRIAPYDPEYYSALYFPDKAPVGLDNAKGFKVKTRIGEDKTTSFYYDMVHPYTLYIDFKTP